jgi:hypothetical protein
MANTYVKIGSTVTVGAGGATSIDFSSIPATYTDLLVDLSVRCDRGGTSDSMRLRFNASTSGYSDRTIQGNGSGTPTSFSNLLAGAYLYLGEVNASGTTASTFTSEQIYVPNYASSNAKSVSIDDVLENNAVTGIAQMVAGLWSGTGAITAIAITCNASNFVQYSTATLYGILKS